MQNISNWITEVVLRDDPKMFVVLNRMDAMCCLRLAVGVVLVAVGALVVLTTNTNTARHFV